MKKTDNYRSHHAEIRLILSDIKSHLNDSGVKADPEPISIHTRKLFGKFSTHLALEDKAFYPRAIANDNKELSHTAERFQKEMGGLGDIFDGYRKKWPGPIAIAKDPAAFVNETENVIKLLEERLQREENELYDLYDRHA